MPAGASPGGLARAFSPRAIVRAIGLFALLNFGLALPAQASTCAPAATRGTAPSDYQNYCWLDFTGYNDALAQAGGQPFSFTLPDGSTLSLTLQVTTNRGNPALNAHSVPSWSGSAIGNSGFNGIPGNPVLYESQNGSTVTVVLNNISVTPPLGSGVTDTYAIIAADGESSNQNESLQFTTNGNAWAQVAQIPNGSNYPTVAGVGSATVTETGVAGTVGSFAFASFNNPTQITATMVGGGLQGAIFAVRYASMSVTAQFNGARANPADQFVYSIKTLGGTTLATGTTTGAGAGPFPAASLSTIAAGYPFVVSEAQAPGSVSPIADYAQSLTCTNQATGSSTTALPNNLVANTYTFPGLQYGDAISCVFTDTANRTNLTIAKSGPANVNAGAAVAYTLVVSNLGPLSAAGALVQDPAVANFSASSVACTGASGGAVCPAIAQLTIANLQGAGIAIPTLPSGGAVTLVVSGTAGTANITNTAAISAPPGVINSNPTPTSTATTTVTASADLATSLSFPAKVNAGQPVSGTVSFTNNGPSTASGITYTLSVAANLAVAPTLTGLPVGASYAYVPATGAITLSAMPATLASGANVGPITVGYTQPGSATSTVSASINSTTADPNPANNSATATITGAAVADLAAKLTFPATVNAGQPVSGTVSFTNNGPSTAIGITFTLSVAANLAAAPTVTGLPVGASYAYVPATGVITLSGMPATLAAGANVGPITVGYTQPGSATSTVSASINATTTDPNPANNSATVTITGAAIADLAAKLTFPATVNAGQPVLGTVLFTNNGPSTASGITYTLSVAANLAVAPTVTGLPVGASYTYVPATGMITLSGMPATLAAGANVGPIGVGYTQPGSATSTVSTSINATTTDPNPANNSATVTITGAAVADLAVKLTFPTNVNAGQPVSGTVLFTNNGPSTASGTTYTLSVAANLVVAPTVTGLPAGATFSYAPATGVITLSGMPATLAAGTNVGPISVGYTQPASGTSVVTASINSTTTDPNPANNSATVTIGGTMIADVATTLAFPATVNAGQPVAGTVLYTNNGPSTASATTYTLSVAANLAVAPTLTGLPAGASYVYAPATGVITLSGMPATLAAGANVGPITVGYVQPASGTSVVTASINSTTSDPNPANNSATVAIGGAMVADVAVKLTFPATVNAGQPVSGTVLFTNNGPSSASGITFTLSVAANLAVAPTLTGLPAGATFSYAPATGVITLSGMPATLAAGANVGPISVGYTQPGSATSTVSAAITTTTIDPNLANNSATATITGIAVADVAVKLNFPATVNAGQPVSGTVLYTNNGPSTASGTTFTLSVPANLAVAPTLTGLPAGVTYSYAPATGVITLSGMPATLASGANLGPISVGYTQPGSATSTVSASINATTSDPNPANNSATVTIAGSAAADLATKLAFPAHANADQPVAGTVLFTNNGPSTASGIAFTLSVAANLAVAPTLTGLPAGASYAYVPATGVIILSGMPATLAAGANVGPINVGYTQPAAATSTVTAAVNSTTTDPNPANNSATATITGITVADVAVKLNFPATVNAGQPVSGTVLYTNNGPSSASGVTFTLSVAANLAVAPTLTGLPAGVIYSYAPSTGVITLSGMPSTLAAGASVGPINLSYTQPASGKSTVHGDRQHD